MPITVSLLLLYGYVYAIRFACLEIFIFVLVVPMIACCAWLNPPVQENAALQKVSIASLTNAGIIGVIT